MLSSSVGKVLHKRPDVKYTFKGHYYKGLKTSTSLRTRACSKYLEGTLSPIQLTKSQSKNRRRGSNKKSWALNCLPFIDLFMTKNSKIQYTNIPCARRQCFLWMIQRLWVGFLQIMFPIFITRNRVISVPKMMVLLLRFVMEKLPSSKFAG